MKTIAVIAATSALMNTSCFGADSLTADLIITNATVRTMDPNHPLAEALAVCRNRIVAVGLTKDIGPLAGVHTRMIDAGGKLVLPGFNDAHVHFLSGGFQLAGMDVRDAKTPAELAERLGRFAKGLPQGRWITGGNWDHERWPGAPLPSKELIDPVTPRTPVFVSRLDGHMALANSVALKLAGVTRRTLDGKHPDGWIPEQKITVEEAVRAYTVGSAYAEFQEVGKGTIRPGKLADVVMLDRNIFKIPPVEIENAQVVMTIFDGQVVYQR